MKELSDSKPVRPFIAQANDAGVINNLLGFINDPAITGAEPPKKQKVVKAPLAIKQTESTESPLEFADAAEPVPAVRSAPQAFFLTGRPGSGRRFIAEQTGARVISLDAGARSLISELAGGHFSADEIDSFLPEVRAWGSSDIPKGGISCLLFVSLIHEAIKSGSLPEQYADFGAANFWVDTVTALAKDYLAAGERVAITDVSRESDFRRLVSSGYTHYHVMCAAATPGKRGVLRTEPFAAALDNDVIRKISNNRSGPRLRCIWNDNTAAPAPRFYSVSDFVSAFKQ